MSRMSHMQKSSKISVSICWFLGKILRTKIVMYKLPVCANNWNHINIILKKENITVQSALSDWQLISWNSQIPGGWNVGFFFFFTKRVKSRSHYMFMNWVLYPARDREELQAQSETAFQQFSMWNSIFLRKPQDISNHVREDRRRYFKPKQNLLQNQTKCFFCLNLPRP